MKSIKRNEEELKKLVEEYLKKPYKIQIEYSEEDKAFFAEVVELPGCMTYGDSWEEVHEMIQDAMRAWITMALERGKEIPEPMATTRYSGRFVVRVPKSLHKELVEYAKQDGISLNQLVQDLLSIGLFVRKNKYVIKSFFMEEEVNSLDSQRWEYKSQSLVVKRAHTNTKKVYAS